MRRKGERRGGNINADAANAEVFAGDEHSRERLSAPWLRFHGGGAADVYIIIRVRASGCGESALNPPTSQRIPRRRSSPCPSLFSPPARALSHSLPAHFRSPTQRRRTPADLTTHSPPKACSRPPQRRALPLPSCHIPAAQTHARRLRDARPPTPQPIPRRKPAPAPAQRHALPLPSCHIPAAQTHARRPHNTFPAEDLLPPPAQRHALPLPSCHIPAAPTHTRRPHDPFPAEGLRPSPSVPLRAQKNGTAQWMCDAECLGRPSLRSVIGVGEPRAVRRRCGALAWRVGLRPQPWALRSRRCGRVLRA